MAVVRKHYARAAALILAVLALGAFWTAGPARSFPADDSAPVKWEYTTIPVEASALPARLNELGEQGWEVFSLERSDHIVEQGSDGNTHLIVVTYEVTGKRPRH